MTRSSQVIGQIYGLLSRSAKSSIILLCTQIACSQPRGEAEPSAETQSPNAPRSTADLSQAKPSYSLVKTMGPGLQISLCEEECEPWSIDSKPLKLCRQPVVVYRQSRALASAHNAEGSEVIKAIFISLDGSQHVKPPTHPPETEHTNHDHSAKWRLIWEGVVASEMIAGGHTESIFTRVDLRVDRSKPLSDQRPCYDLITRHRQRARSFNRVDAREREFDGEEVEERRFVFRLATGSYQLQAPAEEPRIKVRLR